MLSVKIGWSKAAADANPSLLGDDATAREHAVQQLIDQVIEPAWVSLNLSRLDGNSSDQASQALNEARTAPLVGEGESAAAAQPILRALPGRAG